MVHFHSKQLCVAEVTHSSTLAMRWIWAISICCSRSMGEAIGYYNSITTHRYHKETIRHSFTAHYSISLRCTLFEFYNTEIDRDSSNSGHVECTTLQYRACHWFNLKFNGSMIYFKNSIYLWHLLPSYLRFSLFPSF